MDEELRDLFEALKFDENGLIPCVVQDHETKEVLMLAYMNKDALIRTLSTKKAHYYSRSRKKIWLKGEESGHHQTVMGVYIDCDGDALLLSVKQEVAACHTGYYSCFFRSYDDGLRIVGKKVFDEKEVYKK